MRSLFLFLLLTLSFPAFSQTADQLKEAQKQLEKLTPEQKKMMEQMGINPDPMSALPKGTDVAQAMADVDNFVPKKNDAGIATATKTVLTNSTMPAFIASTNATVAAKIKPAAKDLGEKTFKAMSAEKKSAKEVGNNAVGLWMAGQPEIALYVMGKACQMDPSNTDHLNNYASMLSMSGGPQFAIPILNKLNAQFPRNSTILNNLGQAWFGLGDLARADKYLDSTLKIYANHPQANMTKAAIEEKKGNKDAAVTHVKKSIQHAFTPEKQNKLRKLGVKLTSSDLRFRRPFKPDSDPLGLHRFERPKLPKTVEEQVLYADKWKAFKLALGAESDKVTQKWHAATAAKSQEAMKVATAMMNNQKLPGSDRGSTMYSALGKIMLDGMEKDGGNAFRMKSAKQALVNFQNVELKKMKADYEAEANVLNKKAEDYSRGLKKEGGDEKETFCDERRQLLNKYLARMALRFEELYGTYLKQLSLQLNEETYWKQFTQWPEDFQVTQLNAQQQWLSALNADYILLDLTDPVLKDCINASEEIPAGNKLPDFDVVNCNLKSELYLYIGSIKIDCNVMTTKFKLSFLEAQLMQDMNKTGFFESYTGCTVKLSAGLETLREVPVGPIDLEAEIEGALEFEFDRTGLKDVTASVGLDVVGNGAEVKVSLVSGKVSTETQTILDNIPR